MELQACEEDSGRFAEFRQKVRSLDVLSASMRKLLEAIHFTGNVCVTLQNGQVLKSGYQEGYFRQDPGRSNESQ
jgi:hypothetical protein